ncbi:ABC transporter [Streptomyces sp. NPDC002055]|uniref:ABC transporter n=1 Tax=Streptomyces sp. NPDC002055 TaxID=3154534 RepID=UPI00333438D0
MTALVRYQAALLLRSQRWLPPVLLYAAFLVVSVQAGQPVLDSLGYAAAALLPVTAWLVRVCATNEPAAARHCAAAAAGAARVHLAAVLVALLAAVGLAAVTTLLVAVISDPHSADRQVRVPVLPAAAAGFLGALVCALLGTAVGALCNRPLLHSTGRAVPATALAALLVLVIGGSPANAAVTGLVTGSLTGTVTLPWLPLAASAVLAAAATATACVLSARRP